MRTPVALDSSCSYRMAIIDTGIYLNRNNSIIDVQNGRCPCKEMSESQSCYYVYPFSMAT